MAMPKPQLKTSIYLDPATQAIIAKREVGPGTRSEVIRACVERYDETCRRHLPALADEEWRFLFHVLDEGWLAERASPAYIAAAVGDWLDRLGTKDGKTRELHRRLQAMPYVELMAVLDEVERHCAAVKRGEPTSRS